MTPGGQKAPGRLAAHAAEALRWIRRLHLELAVHLNHASHLTAGRAKQPFAAVASDEALIGRIAVGDELAMEALFARHHVRAYRFILRLVRDEALAEDLISEMFLDVWRQADKFEARSSGSTWLLAIAQFKALSALRRRSDEMLDDDSWAAFEDPADDPEVALQKTDRGQVLQQCLIQLSPKHREIIDLIYYHDRSIKETAVIVGSPESTVKTRMFHARKQLSQLLGARGVDNSEPRYH
jgi:RNA polymerase sigma-70 factor, ECF subfamily